VIWCGGNGMVAAAGFSFFASCLCLLKKKRHVLLSNLLQTREDGVKKQYERGELLSWNLFFP